MRLYPEELYELHEAVRLVSSGGLSLEDKLDIVGQLGPLEDLEKRADELLVDFVKEIPDKVAYVEEIKRKATENAKILYLLRCFIASDESSHRPQLGNSISIGGKREMSTGALMKYYPRENLDLYGDIKDDDPYYRAKMSDDRSMSFVDPKLIDLLPEDLHFEFQIRLSDFVGEVDSVSKARDLLDKYTARSGIEDNIISRILYLITNAEHKDTVDLHNVLADVDMERRNDKDKEKRALL
jgi:hypothetical protein